MHPYSKGGMRKKNILLIVLLVILVSIIYSFLQKIGIIQFLEIIEKNVDIFSPLIKWGFISIVLTPIVIFWIIYELFNRYMWKCKLLNKLIGLPNINGKYEGILQSSFKDRTTGEPIPAIPAILEVVQTYDEIKFCISFPETNSSSRSNMGGLISFEGNIAEFAFTYRNNSRDFEIESTSHDGMNILRFNLDNGMVQGEYFNNRGVVPNKGYMDLNKINS
ncbi:hypothetical protein PDI73_04250 [Lactococcus lactis]|uniref:Cap15 family cyclic dinucleotide receptor domain-containing protein n=1 Tax=Lactococcus lactis TaxID=1358 RepID=UPI00240DB8F6|nr:hypothetical protein [Lactococcus lactis]WFB96755.1 hypothetical protein PDI73_04250 [Lactococcus lactis]